MGPSYLPDEVITLTELGLADFPKTISGKVQKVQLAELVRSFRDLKDHNRAASKSSIHDIILHAYYKATGIPLQNLDLEIPVTNFADSISFMRVRDTLRKELGFTLTVQEMIDYPNIESQIRLLHGRDSQPQNKARSTSEHSGPPSLAEMSIAFGGLSEAKRLKALISKTIESKGFDWSLDVSSIIPAYDYMQILLESEIIISWNFAFAIMANGSSTQVCHDTRRT